MRRCNGVCLQKDGNIASYKEFKNGKFHKWTTDRDRVKAIVELLNGKIVLVKPENLTFTDVG